MKGKNLIASIFPTMMIAERAAQMILGSRGSIKGLFAESPPKAAESLVHFHSVYAGVSRKICGPTS
jgi:hypothetical protein